MKGLGCFRSYLWLLLVVGMVTVAAVSSGQGKGAWRSKMGELSAALSEAVPYLYPDPGQDPKALADKIKKIYSVTKDLDEGLGHSKMAPDGDPALPYIARLLRQDIERAYSALQEGHGEYSKGVIRSSVAYCIACHTRTNGGAEFPLLKAFNQPLKKASWIEKLEFQAASRQFDAVLAEVMTQLEAPGTLGIATLDLERGARLALSIAVRVKKDPDQAALLTLAMTHSPSASVSMKEAGKSWIKEIRAWQDETGVRYKTDDAMLLAARKLLQGDSGPKLGGHNEVSRLRASVLMHDLIRRYPDSPFTSEAFYIVGRSYDSLRDVGLWSLHEMYFLACIDKAPHTSIAEKCYREYDESITLGYSGSRGIHIPSAVRKHLSAVKEKAFRKAELAPKDRPSN